MKYKTCAATQRFSKYFCSDTEDYVNMRDAVMFHQYIIHVLLTFDILSSVLSIKLVHVSVMRAIPPLKSTETGRVNWPAVCVDYELSSVQHSS